MSRVIDEADAVIRMASRQRRAVESVSPYWNSDKALYFAAYIAEGFGLGALDESLEVSVSSSNARSVLESLLPVPTAILGMPVDDSEGMWWSAAAKCVEDRVLIGDHGYPMIGSIVDGYHRYLREKGLMMTPEAHRLLSEECEQLSEGVSMRIASLMSRRVVDKQVMSAASRIIGRSGA